MTRASMLRVGLRVLVVAAALGASRGAALAACVGDCGGDGQVAINELIRGVAVALGNEPPSACAAFQNAQGEVTIAQLIQGVNNALNGCPLDDGLLVGPPEGRALDAVADVFSSEAYTRAGERSGPLIRTQVELAFRKDATVAAVNDLLRRFEGRIVASRQGVAIVVVRIPDPGGTAALDQLLAELAADPLVRAANPVVMPRPNVLPDTINIDAGETSLVRHHLAVRAHAAWNARAALAGATSPTLVLGDYFGGGPPDAMLYGPVGHPNDFAPNTGAVPNEHGYHVLGIAAGQFDTIGTTSSADAVTGMFPGPLALRAVDHESGLGTAVMNVIMLALIRSTPGNVVLNTSLGSPCDTIELAAKYCSRDAAVDSALCWIEQVRGSDWPDDQSHDLEGKFLHTTAAGNVEAAGRLGADVSSEWNAATLIAPLIDPTTLELVPNLTNTLVVENFMASSDEPYEPGCISPSSEQGGTIAAIGTDVFSFIAPTTTGSKTGTSMATPQVAGLAAYVWALWPDLAPTDVVALLRRTAQVREGCGTERVIDAYAAVLATDEGDPTLPARSAILDVADGSGNEGRNGAFDEADLDLTLTHIDAPGLRPLDYGRYDLNGDGSTGSGVTGGSDRVDLDLDGTYGLATVDIEGLPVRFDEEFPSDRQVLCHSAYSSAYTGDEQVRRDRLGLARCVEVDLEVLFPTTVQPALNNLLTVRVVDLDLGDPGSELGQAGVRIELNPSGGTVDQFAGITNADGIFQTNARLFAGQPKLIIEVVASAGEGGLELARKTVQASAAGGGVTRISSRGTITAHVPGFPNEEACLVEQFRHSPAGVTAWSDTLFCSGLNGSGGPEQGSATAAFMESYAGRDLVAVTATFSGTASSDADGTGQYELTFSVVQTTTIAIDAELTASGFSLPLFLFVGGAEPIRSVVAGSIHETQTLGPGNYSILIHVVGQGGGASFNLAVTFGTAG